jgi:hypothetical protein
VKNVTATGLASVSEMDIGAHSVKNVRGLMVYIQRAYVQDTERVLAHTVVAENPNHSVTSNACAINKELLRIQRGVGKYVVV